MEAARYSRTLIGACLTLAGAGILAYQSLRWLEEGFWTPAQLRSMLGAGSKAIGWRSIETMLDQMWATPLGVSLIIVGLVIGCLGLASGRRDE